MKATIERPDKYEAMGFCFGPNQDQDARWVAISPKGYVFEGYGTSRNYFFTKKEALEFVKQYRLEKTDDPFYN